MTLDELIERLGEARDDLGGQAEVRVAYQPSWPLRGTIASVTVTGGDTEPHCDDHVCYVASCADCQDATQAAAEDTPGTDSDDTMAWIAVGSAPYAENPYAPRWAWND